MPKDTFKHRADNLARLLADEHGAEILAELQKLSLESAHAVSPRTRRAGEEEAGVVGVWQVLPTPDGPAMRRRALSAEQLRTWADVEHIPAAGRSTRVALLGESSGRGFLLDPLLTPAIALERRLNTAGGDFQVVDLARTGADLRDLMEIMAQVPLAEPDVIVVYAGNNWVRSRHSPAHLDLLAAALREGGYPEMRRAFLDRIVAPGARRVLDRLASVASACQAEVVLVVPEFNLQGWSPDPELELPPLAPEHLARWSRARALAEDALAEGPVDGALGFIDEMAGLDQGMSPLTGWLRARAADAAGRPDTRLSALRESRDAACGLLTTHTPRITEHLREFLLAGAAERGFRCVDLAELLALGPGPSLPDPGFFLDYCHLSSTGIERFAAAATDAIMDRPAGTTEPLDVLSPADRAIGDVLAAMHNSYYGQTQERVEQLVVGAVHADPAGRSFCEALLRLLEGTGPVWSSAAVRVLTERPHAERYLATMLSRSAETLGMWTLHEALLAAVGPQTPGRRAQEKVDLLATAEQGLIDGAFLAVNHLPERAYFQAFGARSVFGFRSEHSGGGRLRVTYRIPAVLSAGDPVVVSVNGHRSGELRPRDSWATAELRIPDGALEEGVNKLEISWPRGGADWSERRVRDAQALSRGDYPVVLGVQGELFDLLFTPEYSAAAEI